MTAHGQYENQYQRQQVSDYTDTRTQGYMQTVIELSSTLGSAHAIRQLCNGSNDQYWRGYMLRQHVKDGMTGWAQVNGLRGDTSLRKRIQYDLFYVRHWSIGFDLRIR